MVKRFVKCIEEEMRFELHELHKLKLTFQIFLCCFSFVSHEISDPDFFDFNG